MHPLDIGSFPVRLLAGFAAAGFLWWVAADFGAWLVAPVFSGRVARATFGAVLGYAVVGSLVALLGTFHLSVASVDVVIALLVVRLPTYPAKARRLPEPLRDTRQWFAQLPILSRGALVLAALSTITALLSAALPAVWWDPIAYHLPIASAALAHGSFAFDPGMVQSAFPALGEAASLPAYALAGSAGAAMSTLIAGLVLALVCALLAEQLAPGTGPLAGALVMSSAMWLWLAPTSYVDVPFALFAVAALAVPIIVGANARAQERGTTSSATDVSSTVDVLRMAALCGAFAGAAAAVKYPGLVIGVVAFAMLIYQLRGRINSTAPYTVGGFAAGFILIAVGWYARNLAATGDPVYPFLAGALGLPSPIVAFAARYIDMTRHWCGGGTSFADLVLLPWRLLVEPRSFCGDPGYALRLGVIFAIACVATARRSWPLAAAVIALTLFWFESSQEWRFLMPSLALMAVLAAVGIAAVSDRLRAPGAAILLLLGALGVAVNWLPGTLRQASSSVVPGYSYISGREDGPAYLRRRLETYSAAEWLRSRGIERASVMSLDDVRTYYFWGGIAWANPYYQQRWQLDWTAPPAARYGALRGAGYRYLFVNANGAYVHRTPTGVEWTVLSNDVRVGALQRVFSDGDVAVYEMRGTP